MIEADRNLDSIRRFERPSVDIIREHSRDLAQALQALHERGIVHGDAKMINAVRSSNKILLIDLDAACRFEEDGSCEEDDHRAETYMGAKFSSGVLPVEMFATLSAAQHEQYLSYWQDVRESNPGLWKKLKSVPIGKGKLYAQSL